jgi:hypothetical protein
MSFEKRKPSEQPRNRGFRKRIVSDHYLKGAILASRIKKGHRHGQRHQT